MELKEATARCEMALGVLEGLFCDDCRLTLLVRSPPEDDADIILTKDSLGKVIDAIEQLQKRELERPATQKESAMTALIGIIAEVAGQLEYGGDPAKALRRIARLVGSGFAGVEGGRADAWLTDYLERRQHPADLFNGPV